MEQRHLILVDEQSQGERLMRMTKSLSADGIQLIYEEINPNDYSVRQENGDLKLDKDALEKKLGSISFLSQLDVFATDYNLVDDELKGIDLIKMLYNVFPHYRNHVVMYSAQIEDVIKNIIIERTSDFSQQVQMLKLLTRRNEIHYLSSDGSFENDFKQYIIKEPNVTIEARLGKSLLAIDNEKFKCSIPGYTDKRMYEIGKLLLENSPATIGLKKDITEHILAYITSIQDYE